MGNGIVTGASADRGIGARHARRRDRHRSMRTPISAPTTPEPFAKHRAPSSPGKAVGLAAAALRDNILAFASAPNRRGVVDSCKLDGGCGVRQEAHQADANLTATGHCCGIIASTPSARPTCRPAPPRSTCRASGSPCNRVTGEIRILHSAHAADIGRLINPMQCRGQIDGAIGMGIGWA
jgi:hypothetical protein